MSTTTDFVSTDNTSAPMPDIKNVNVPAPCPSCGHCPTCGRRPRNHYPFDGTYYPWRYYPYTVTYSTDMAYINNSASCC